METRINGVVLFNVHALVCYMIWYQIMFFSIPGAGFTGRPGQFSFIHYLKKISSANAEIADTTEWDLDQPQAPISCVPFTEKKQTPFTESNEIFFKKTM
jgi:hypothetical protein